MDTNTDESFEALLRYMRDSRGFDFTGYKRVMSQDIGIVRTLV